MQTQNALAIASKHWDVDVLDCIVDVLAVKDVLVVGVHLPVLQLLIRRRHRHGQAGIQPLGSPLEGIECREHVMAVQVLILSHVLEFAFEPPKSLLRPKQTSAPHKPNAQVKVASNSE